MRRTIVESFAVVLVSAVVAFALLPVAAATATEPRTQISPFEATANGVEVDGPNAPPVPFGTDITYISATLIGSPGGPVPTGSITFTTQNPFVVNGGGTFLCTAELVSTGTETTGSCTSNTLPVGGCDPSVEANQGCRDRWDVWPTYSGDANYPPGGFTGLDVYVVPDRTTTVASVTPSTGAPGQSVTYAAAVTNANVADITPTGTVRFTVGSQVLCTGTVVGGTAQCISSTAPTGADAVVASYSGETDFAVSSGSVDLTIVAPGEPVPPPAPLPPPVSVGAPTPHGYWLVGGDGGIFTFGSATFFGSTGDLALQRPVVGMTPTTDQEGYWLDASDGGVFAFGDAGFYGSIPGLGIAPAGTPGLGRRLDAPIVGMVPSSDGGGYLMVASDGGVFAFGDARFAGSCPGIGGCAGAAVAVMPDASGNGYWLVTATDHVYTFGDATYHGAPGQQSVPVTSAVRTPDGNGYWILFANGAVAPYGDAQNLGSAVGTAGGLNPATAILTTADGGGYWTATADGSVNAFGDAPDDGGMTGQHLNAPIIAATGW